MALTPSNPLTLGMSAPDFTLPDTITGKKMSLADFKSPKATVIMFICNHCPFVKHVRHEIAQLAKDYLPKGIKLVAISANDIDSYPEDSPEKMHQMAKDLDFKFPYLYDETQEVAKAYQAVCTPEFYIFDHQLKLVYHGQLDDSRPNNGIPVTGHDVRQALDNLLAGNPVAATQKPSIGCNIKWRE